MSKKDSFSALERQRQIYVAGMSGQQPVVPLDFQKLEQKAKEKNVTGGLCLCGWRCWNRIDNSQSNRSDFEKWKIVPRMLRDVSERDTKC